MGVRVDVDRIEVLAKSLMLGREEDHEREMGPSLFLENNSDERERDKGGVDMQAAIIFFFLLQILLNVCCWSFRVQTDNLGMRQVVWA